MVKLMESRVAEGITSCLGEDSTTDAPEQSNDGASETITGNSLTTMSHVHL
jgi:hypothetical protein